MIKVQLVWGNCWVEGFADSEHVGGNHEISPTEAIKLLNLYFQLAKERVGDERRGVIWEEYDQQCLTDGEWADLAGSGSPIDYAHFVRLFKDVKPMTAVEFLID